MISSVPLRVRVKLRAVLGKSPEIESSIIPFPEESSHCSPVAFTIVRVEVDNVSRDKSIRMTFFILVWNNFLF